MRTNEASLNYNEDRLSIVRRLLSNDPSTSLGMTNSELLKQFSIRYAFVLVYELYTI